MNPASVVYRWNILLLLASSQAIAYIDRVNFAVVGPHFVKVYHYTPAEIAVLLSTFNWAFTRRGCRGQPIVSFLGCCELSSRKLFLFARSSAVGCTCPVASVTRDTSVCSPGVAPVHV